jgi:hypothetical protein
MAFYKVTINTIEAVAGGSLNADAMLYLRISRDPDVFQPVANGHRTVVLGAAAVKEITNSSMTANQKRTALRDMIKAEVLAMGIDIADEAYADFIALLPPPQDVTIRDV